MKNFLNTLPKEVIETTKRFELSSWTRIKQELEEDKSWTELSTRVFLSISLANDLSNNEMITLLANAMNEIRKSNREALNK